MAAFYAIAGRWFLTGFGHGLAKNAHGCVIWSCGAEVPVLLAQPRLKNRLLRICLMF